MDNVKPLGVRNCCVALGGLPRGFVRPQKADRGFLAGLVSAPLPPARAEVSVSALPQAARSIATPFIVQGAWKPARVKNAMTAFVVRHPDATFVVDPGICTRVVDRAIAELPLALRAVVKPRRDVLDLASSLELVGISAERLDFALPTHLHWDHVAGLLDLPDLPICVHAIERTWAMTGEVAPVGGVRSAVRGRPIAEYELDGPPVLTFTRSHDLLGDGSVILVDLAGHTPGSVGVLLRTAHGPVLLAGDAAWHSLQVEHIRQKASFPGLLVDEDRAETFRTLHRLHAIRTAVRVIATHDHDAASAIAASPPR
jgi:glyoxylase-like metal-dependent hydrolase (beta-lactamase superfamily II)